MNVTDNNESTCKKEKGTMQRPGLLNAALGESTAVMLTFQNDMFPGTDQNNESVSPKTVQTEITFDAKAGKSSKTRFFTPIRERRREDVTIKKLSLSPRKQRSSSIDDSPEGILRTKSSNNSTIGSSRAKSTMRSIFEDTNTRYKPTVRGMKSDIRSRHDDNDKSVSSSHSNETTTIRNVGDAFNTESARSNNSCSSELPVRTSVVAPQGRARNVPPTRSRPGIRISKSGSMALRQFQANHQPSQPPRHFKKKAEAKATPNDNVPIHKFVSLQLDCDAGDGHEWEKPPIRPSKSMDPLLGFVGLDDPKNHRAGYKSTGEDLDFGGSNHSSHRICGTTFTRVIMEIAPGCHMATAGVDETMHALHLDRIVHVECTSCNTFLACINTASMVICPSCQSISPLENPPAVQQFDQMEVLGMGLRVEDILNEIKN